MPGDAGIFYYEVQSLRIDGDRSADPADYAGRRPDVRLGSVLHAFLVARLPSRLTPRGLRGRPGRGRRGRYTRGGGISWAVPHAVPVAYNPTRRDLDFWSGVRWVQIGCGGLKVLEGAPPSSPTGRGGPEPPLIDLDSLFR